MENKFICPVCGYPELYEDPILDSRTYEICPSCFCEFGFDVFTELPETIIRYRLDWIKSGAKWGSRFSHSPKDWDAIDQMRKAGFFSINNGRQ